MTYEELRDALGTFGAKLPAAFDVVAMEGDFPDDEVTPRDRKALGYAVTSELLFRVLHMEAGEAAGVLELVKFSGLVRNTPEGLWPKPDALRD